MVNLGSLEQGPLRSAPDPLSGSGLRVVFLSCGSAELEVGGSSYSIVSPALIAVHAQQAFLLHRLTASSPKRLIVADVRLTGPVATLFLEEFAHPRIVSLEEEEPALRLAVSMIQSELDSPRCGQTALLSRVGDILFIGLLRHLVANPVMSD